MASRQPPCVGRVWRPGYPVYDGQTTTPAASVINRNQEQLQTERMRKLRHFPAARGVPVLREVHRGLCGEPLPKVSGRPLQGPTGGTGSQLGGRPLYHRVCEASQENSSTTKVGELGEASHTSSSKCTNIMKKSDQDASYRAEVTPKRQLSASLAFRSL